MIDADASEYGTTYRSFERAAPYTNKGVIVDTYVRHHQDWIVPRRVMCAFFWTGIILLFTGIILLVTSKHKKGGYESWGAVLLGLGFCLLLICLILCMHAYCVITVADEEPPRVMTVPPPPPALLTHVNGHKPSHSPAGTSSIGPMYYNESSQGLDSLKSVPEESEEMESRGSFAELGRGGYLDKKGIKGSPNISCREGFLDDDDDQYRDSPKGSYKGKEIYGQSPKLIRRDNEKSIKEKFLESLQEKSNIERRSLDSVGRLPSYSTAIKMPPYSPTRSRALSHDTEVDINHLKEDLKSSTLERIRPQLKKSVTFDDSTGDLRMEFNGGESEEELYNYKTDSDSHVSKLSSGRPSLGSPPYDNEIELHGPSAVSKNVIAPSSSSDLPIRSVGGPPLDLSLRSGSGLEFYPQQQTLSTIPESPSSISDVSSTIACTNTTWSHVTPKTHVPLLTIAPPSHGKTSVITQSPQSHLHVHTSVPATPNPGRCELFISESPNQVSPKESSDISPLSSSLPQSKHSHPLRKDDSITSSVSGQDQQSSRDNSIVLRKGSTDVDSTGSSTSKMSVYDNVQYVWKPKSGSELKHFHF